MLTRRTFLATTATMTAATAAGLDVALAAPQDKLVGHSLLCVYDVLSGVVARDEVEVIYLGDGAREILRQRHERAADNRRHFSGAKGKFASRDDRVFNSTMLDIEELERQGLIKPRPLAMGLTGRLEWTRGGKAYPLRRSNIVAEVIE